MTTDQTVPAFRDRIAASLRAFGVPGTLTFLVIMAAAVLFAPAGAVLILLWAIASRTPWREIGLARPKSWASVVVFGVLLGLVDKFLMKAIVLPLLGAPAVNAAFAHVRTDSPGQLLFLFVYVIVGAGFGEELVFRGYLFERVGKLIGETWSKRILAVLIGAAIFGALHFEQGVAGIENAAISGVVTGLIYFASNRNLWLVAVLHATFDIASFTLIYFSWETAVSQLFFH